jgi:hypothetical protein
MMTNNCKHSKRRRRVEKSTTIGSAAVDANERAELSFRSWQLLSSRGLLVGESQPANFSLVCQLVARDFLSVCRRARRRRSGNATLNYDDDDDDDDNRYIRQSLRREHLLLTAPQHHVMTHASHPMPAKMVSVKCVCFVRSQSSQIVCFLLISFLNTHRCQFLIQSGITPLLVFPQSKVSRLLNVSKSTLSRLSYAIDSNSYVFYFTLARVCLNVFDFVFRLP